MHLWKKTWFKARAGRHIVNTFKMVHKSMLDLGSTQNLLSEKKKQQKDLEQTCGRLIIP